MTLDIETIAAELGGYNEIRPRTMDRGAVCLLAEIDADGGQTLLFHAAGLPPLRVTVDHVSLDAAGEPVCTPESIERVDYLAAPRAALMILAALIDKGAEALRRDEVALDFPALTASLAHQAAAAEQRDRDVLLARSIDEPARLSDSEAKVASRLWSQESNALQNAALAREGDRLFADCALDPLEFRQRAASLLLFAERQLVDRSGEAEDRRDPLEWCIPSVRLAALILARSVAANAALLEALDRIAAETTARPAPRQYDTHNRLMREAAQRYAASREAAA